MGSNCPLCGAPTEVKEFSGLGEPIELSTALTELVDGVIESTGYGR